MLPIDCKLFIRSAPRVPPAGSRRCTAVRALIHGMRAVPGRHCECGRTAGGARLNELAV